MHSRSDITRMCVHSKWDMQHSTCLVPWSRHPPTMLWTSSMQHSTCLVPSSTHPPTMLWTSSSCSMDNWLTCMSSNRSMADIKHTSWVVVSLHRPGWRNPFGSNGLLQIHHAYQRYFQSSVCILGWIRYSLFTYFSRYMHYNIQENHI